MKNFILIGSAVVLAAIIWMLTEANTQILSFIVPRIDNYSYDKFAPAGKAFAYALATVLCVLYYRQLWIKSLFILIDGALIFLYIYFPPESWSDKYSFVYAIFTMLIFAFIGNILHQFYLAHIKKREDKLILVDEVKEYKDKMAILADKLKKSEIGEGKREEALKEWKSKYFKLQEKIDMEKAELESFRLKEAILKIKQSSGRGKKWYDDEVAKKEVEEMEDRLAKIEHSLLNKVTKDNIHPETPTGKIVGKEGW